MSDNGSSVSVLVLGWRRPAELSRVLSHLRAFGFDDFFVSIDGPRSGHEGDKKAVELVYGVVEKELDGLRFQTKFSAINRGLRESVLSGAEWFFEHREEGLVIEDDDLPVKHLHNYVRHLLDTFREVTAVTQINCTSHVPEGVVDGLQPFLSRFHHSWGFATWRDSWEGFVRFARDRTTILPSDFLSPVPGFPSSFYRSLSNRVNRERSGAVDTWASSWLVFNLLRRTFAVTPPTSLVQNIGFGNSATNAKRVPLIAGGPPKTVEVSWNLFPPEKDVAYSPDLDKVIGLSQWNTLSTGLRGILAALELIFRIGRGPLRGSSPTVAQRFLVRRYRVTRSARKKSS